MVTGGRHANIGTQEEEKAEEETMRARSGHVCIQGPDTFNEDRREGCYIQVRSSDNRIQTASSGTLNTYRSSRRAGDLEDEGDFPVYATTFIDDTSNQPNHTATLGACPRPDQGEVQGQYHPSPGNHQGITARATFSSLAAASKWDGQSQHRAGGWRHKVDAGHYSSSWGAVPAGGHRQEGRQRHLSCPLRSVFGEDYRMLVPSSIRLRQRCPWLQLRDSPWRSVTRPYFSS